jgi:hypothetical protein
MKKMVYCVIKPTWGCKEIVRIIRRLVEPSLKYKSGRGDKVYTVFNGITTRATVQNVSTKAASGCKSRVILR